MHLHLKCGPVEKFSVQASGVFYGTPDSLEILPGETLEIGFRTISSLTPMCLV